VGIFIIDKIIGMKKITDIEKQRILELHQNTPMKPFLFEQNDNTQSTIKVRFKDGKEKVFFINSPEWQKFYYDNELNKTYSPYKWNGKLYDYDWSKEFKNWSSMSAQERKSAIENSRKIMSVGSYKDNPNLISSTLYALTHSHEVNMITEIGLSFIPFIGPFLAAGIGLYDAYLYKQEGNDRMAGFVGILSILPAVGTIASKIPAIAKLGQKGMSLLGNKIARSGLKGLEKEEMTFVKEIANAIKDKNNLKAIDDYVKTTAKNILETKGTDLFKNAEQFNKFKGLTNVGLGLGFMGTVAGMYNPAYTAIYGKTAKEIIEDKGEDYDLWKNAFHSTGSKEDDELMKKAMTDVLATKCGNWSVNRPVPLKYQTKKYKNEIVEIVKGLDMIAKINPKNDCREDGTFGKSLMGKSNDPYEYKFFNGKYFTKKKTETDWIDVSNSQKIKNAIEKMFVDLGFKKDEKGLFFVK
jgi:hypothetical protein